MVSSPRILLVEGQSAGRESLSVMLQKADFDTIIVRTGVEAQTWLENNSPTLIIFDASTMRSNGVRNCRRLRRLAEFTPIIHSRSFGEEEDHSAGADVYLERPFTPRKLLNRVRALLPADSSKEEIIRYGRITFYLVKKSVDVVGKGEFSLTPKLALLLENFIRHPNELITRPKLMLAVWQTDFIGDTRTLDVHIRWIRECIEDDPSRPELLKTVRGQGYILKITGSPDANHGHAPAEIIE